MTGNTETEVSQSDQSYGAGDHHTTSSHHLRSGSIAKGVRKSVSKTVKNLTHEHEYTWHELQAIEKRRRAVLRRNSLSFFRIIFFFDGTVLRALLTDFLFYATMMIYSVVRIGARYGLPDFVSGLGGADIGILGAFLSFFLVFFVNNSSQRFDKLYRTSMSCEGRIFDVAALAKIYLPRERALRLLRYLNAVHMAGYVGLSDTYTYQNFFLQINQSNHILTPEECDRMEEIDVNNGGSACRALVTWCCAEVASAQRNDLIDNRLASQLRELILRLRGALGTLYDYDDQPVSFFYLHFICLLSALYLPLFAISAALDAGTGDDSHWVSDVVAGLIVALQAVFVIGLRILGQRLSEPYGDDIEDLSVIHYVNFAWRMSTRMLLAQLPSSLDTVGEKEWHEGTQSYGDAWGWARGNDSNNNGCDDSSISHFVPEVQQE